MKIKVHNGLLDFKDKKNLCIENDFDYQCFYLGINSSEWIHFHACEGFSKIRIKQINYELSRDEDLLLCSSFEFGKIIITRGSLVRYWIKRLFRLIKK